MVFEPVACDPREPARGRLPLAKSVAVQVLKLCAATGVVVYLWARGHIAWDPLREALGRWDQSVPAFLLLSAMPLVQFWRWQSLLRGIRLHLPHREVFSFLMVSKFFNMAFPGYISGDILRGFYVSRRASEYEGSAPSGDTAKLVESNTRVVPPAVVASIVLDRIAGLIPLFALCLVGLFGLFSYPLPTEVVLSAGTLAVIGLLAPLLLFLLTYRRPRPESLLSRLARWPRLAEFVSVFCEGAHQYARNLKLIRNVLAFSFLNQGLAIVSFILFGRALGIEAPVMSYFLLVPLGLLVTAVPVSPAGLGVGQVAFLALFHLVGAVQGANLFTLYMASYVVINLTGAILYVFPVHAAMPAHPAGAPKIQPE